MRILITLVSLVLLAQPVDSAAQPSPPAYRVIVNPRNPAREVSRRFLASAFLKKTTSWSDGRPILPVDLAGRGKVRTAFSEAVLGRSVGAVRNYWTQQVFSGRNIPPPELSSDDAVVAYVLKHRGAVGYVSGTADIREAKLLTVR